MRDFIEPHIHQRRLPIRADGIGTMLVVTVFIGALASCGSVGSVRTDERTVMSVDTSAANRMLAYGNQLYKTAKFDSSIVCYEQALPIFRRAGMNDQYALCLDYLNVSYRSIAQFSRALDYCDIFLRFAIATWGAQSAQTANAYSSTGVVYQVMGDFERSLDYHLQALAIRRELFGEESNPVGISVSNLAVVYHLKGNYDTSIEYHLRAIRIREKLLGPTNQGLGSNWLNLGVVYRIKADYEKTLECYEKALRILSAALGLNHPRVAMVYGNMAIVHDLLGDFERSQEYHLQALRIREATLGPDHPLVAGTLNDVGILLLNQDRYEEALDFLARSNALFLKKLPDENGLIAQSFKNMGNASRKLGRMMEAKDLYVRALEVGKKVYKDDHPEIALAYFQLGEVYADLHQADSARLFHDSSLAILRRSLGTHHPLIGMVYLAKSRMAGDERRYDEALRYNHLAMDALQEDGDRGRVISETDLLETLAQRAAWYIARSSTHGLNDLDSASQVYDRAAILMDQMRRSTRAEGSKLFWAGRNKKIVEDALRLELRRYGISGDRRYLDRAFFWAEKSKAAVLRDAMVESKAVIFSGLPDSLMEQEKRFKLDMTFYETRIQQELEKGASSTERELLEKNYFETRNLHDTFIRNLETNYPRYFKLKYPFVQTSIPSVQKMLDDRSMLVEYFAGDSVLAYFLITATTSDVVLQARDSALDVSVAGLRTALLQYDFENIVKHTDALSRRLIRPLKPRLGRIEKLLIVPDGILHHVPFDALFTEDVKASPNPDFTRLPYLVRTVRTGVLYSAEFLHNDEQQPLDSGHVLAVAPVFDGDVRWKSLPASRQEVETIDKLFRDRSVVRKLVGVEATERRFKTSDLYNSRILHLSSHGVVNSAYPKLSGVAFWSDSTAQEDGMLYASEIYGLSLRADLVTLSACESGFGSLARGEGLMGLTRSFMYAGARRMLVSLWRVDDQVTGQLMSTFYREAIKTGDYLKALQRAKLQMIEQRKSAYPGDWSAFILIGK